MLMHSYGRVALGVFVPLIVLISSCRENSPTSIGLGFRVGPILFVSNKTGTNQLYSMNEDGSNVRQITSDPNFPVDFASWSPDGKKIAFTSDAGGVPLYGPAIYVMNADGTGLHQLTIAIPEGPNFASGDRPAWSPDGKRIAFHRVMIPELLGNTDLFVINADGTDERRLTTTRDTAEYAGSWSRDGKFVYFAYFDYTRVDSEGILRENDRIARIDVDRASIVNVSPPDDVDSGPVSSPDDSLIVFSSLISLASHTGYARQLYVMTPGGTNRRKLIGDGYRDEDAAGWSADGRRILCNGQNAQLVPYQNPPRDILIIGSDGSGMRKITPFDYREALSIATSWRKE
jgi:TolB protein